MNTIREGIYEILAGATINNYDKNRTEIRKDISTKLRFKDGKIHAFAVHVSTTSFYLFIFD